MKSCGSAKTNAINQAVTTLSVIEGLPVRIDRSGSTNTCMHTQRISNGPSEDLLAIPTF